MDDDDQEVQKPPKMPKLFHIFCDNVNTMTGTSVIEKIGFPYEKNKDDSNLIIGT